jgi:hypothetical protein
VRTYREPVITGGWLIFELPPAEVADQRWGLVTRIRLPGGGELGLYEPRHPRATQL